MNFYITIGDIQNRIAEFHQNNDMTPDFPEILRSLYKDHKYKQRHRNFQNWEESHS